MFGDRARWYACYNRSRISTTSGLYITVWVITSMFGVHPDLRTYVSAAFFVSAALAVAGIASLFYGAIVSNRTQWPFIIFGAIAISSSFLGVVVVPRWYRHSTKVVSSVTPRPGRIRLEIESDSDSPSLYGTVIDVAEPQPRLLLLMPSWHVEPIVGIPISAAIYRDPLSHRPVAFGTSSGFLWCVPGWQGVA